LNFPEASGSRTGNPSGVDVYVAKLSPAGKLLYITYLGGSGDDRGYGIAVDSSGAAVVAGWTYSTNFPVVNGAQPRLGGGRDGFVAKLNAAGNALVFSTYLGGSGADSGNAVALDPQGNIYVAGETDSTNFPVLNGFQTQIGGRQDAFLAKFSGAGTKLYGTYLGGVGDDRATAIAVDASGNAYITGSTFSTNLPVASAFQPKLGGGQDAFAAKIGPTGSALIYSTYLGGSGGTISAPEIGNGIAVDSAGCAYIAGTTSSSNFPTSNPLKSSLSGSQDAFVLKLSASGNALVYSTYLGGSSIDMAMAIAVDSTGRAYVAGYTASTDFPTISAVQSTYAGGYDAFIAVLTTLGNALTMATYWGGLASDSANAIVVDSAGNISIAGQTQSTDFPLSAAIQVFEPSAMSTFVARLAFAVVNPPVAAVTFLKSDAATQGSWRGVYGTDGSAIAMDSTNYPSYALATVGGTAYTWNPSTTDSRALQKYAGTDRIASTWYAASAYTIDLNLTDGNVHQVALYCVDWENGGRIERIDVLDAVTGSVLDTRSVSGFTAGRYLVWNMSGHATFRVTALSNNAVVSGIFFGAGTQTSATAAATFTKADITTQGNWKGAYGLDGSAIAMDSTHYPSYAQVTVGGTPYAWTTSTADLRALQKYAATDRIASTWYAASAYTIDLNLTDGNAHQVALYCVDWENGGRIERIDVLDAVTGGVLDTRTVSGFKAGQYLVWNVSGHITFRVTALSNNAVVSGIFFGAGTQTSATAAATFSKADITTQGSWKGAYGLDGSAIAMDSTHYPSYAQVTVGGTPYAWTTSTADSRALQKYAATDRIASTWYAATAYTIDVNLTDGVAHQVALYSVDWENGGRSERIDALDALSGSVLDSRTISGFSAGQYLVWNLSGHVTFRVTPLSNNAVVSGIFFR
jgi:hypothetical protein